MEWWQIVVNCILFLWILSLLWAIWALRQANKEYDIEMQKLSDSEREIYELQLKYLKKEDDD